MRTSDTGAAPEWDQGLSWLALLYGVYCAAYEATASHDELQIAFGIEMVIVALLDFVWLRAPASLGAGLIVTGIAAPVTFVGVAPLYWHTFHMFRGEAFWSGVVLGTVVMIPLVLLGLIVLKNLTTIPKRTDPSWFQPVRWTLRGGLWTMVLAFRVGDWNSGVPLVIGGAALALTSLAIALPYRIAVKPGGIGRFLMFLGGSALVVTCVAKAGAGRHMSGSEAMVGVIPAGLLLAIGALIAWKRSGKPPPT